MSLGIEWLCRWDSNIPSSRQRREGCFWELALDSSRHLCSLWFLAGQFADVKDILKWTWFLTSPDCMCMKGLRHKGFTHKSHPSRKCLLTLSRTIMSRATSQQRKGLALILTRPSPLRTCVQLTVLGDILVLCAYVALFPLVVVKNMNTLWPFLASKIAYGAWYNLEIFYFIVYRFIQ